MKRIKFTQRFLVFVIMLSFLCNSGAALASSDITPETQAETTIGADTTPTGESNESKVPDGTSESTTESETTVPESETTETEEETESSAMMANLMSAPADPDAPTSILPTDPSASGFVVRMYETCFDRTPAVREVEAWVILLESGQSTAAEIIEGFLFSQELANKNLSNSDFVELLYNAILGRASDASGKASWVEHLDAGLSKNYACAGFNGSIEFYNLCQSYNISPGTFSVHTNTDKNPSMALFVSRLYRKILNRAPEAAGMENWVTALCTKRNTASEAVQGFIFSQEFLNRNLSNADYVTVLYQAILDREPDANGLNAWCDNLNDGVSRHFVLRGFLLSVEFTNMCNKYNITRGELTLTEPRDANQLTTRYIMRCFQYCLERPANTGELNTWASQVNASGYAADLLNALVSNLSSLSNTDYVKRIYKTYLHRDASASEVNAGVNQLAAGTSRSSFTSSVAGSTEHANLLAKYGLKVKPVAFQNPSGYIQIQTSIAPLTGGGYELNPGYMGVKVYYVQKKLGLYSTSSRAIVDQTFRNAVMKYQSSHSLKVDGIVGLNTWRSLGYSDNDWYNLGTYISPMLIGSNRTRSDCIEAMITTAYKYLNTPYVIGASGAPGTGVDCSGLVMQGLYAAGVDLSPINPIRHSQPGYEYESRNMWTLSTMKHVSYAERQRGDLIFYQNSNGVIIHVAIYLGNDQVIEAWPPETVVWPIKNWARSNIAGVVRPFVNQ